MPLALVGSLAGLVAAGRQKDSRLLVSSLLLTFQMLSATAYGFEFETSPDGATWNILLEGKATKK